MMVLLLLLVGRAFVRSFSSSSSLLQLFRERERESVCVVRGETELGGITERQGPLSLCEIFSIFQFLFCFLVQHTFPLFFSFCRQIKIISSLVSLNRRGKKHNREEGEKEEDKEEDKEEEEER